MFCMRSAKAAYPQDMNGIRFAPACEGGAVPDDLRADPKAARLISLLDKRPATVAALDQTFGKVTVPQSKTFADDELKQFTWKLLPFYSDDPDDEAMDRLLPRSTEALSKVLDRVSQPNDPDAVAVREAVSRLSGRLGYRTPERVLAIVRPLLTYDRLDELAEALVGLMAPDEAGHEAFIGLLQATALELAEPLEPKNNPTTLSTSLQLLLEPDPLYTEAALASGMTLAPLPVLERDPVTGDAIPVAGASSSPFPIAGRSDDADRAQGTLLALAEADEPAYQTFDANPTLLASLLRDAIPLVRREGSRSAVENILRGARPLLGPNVARTEPFGNKTFSYQGPDIEHGPMGALIWSFTNILKLPETRPMLQVLQALLEQDENGATQLVNLIYNMDAKTDDPAFAGKLNGTNEFWDDLIRIGQRVIEKPGRLKAILNATMTPENVASGVVFGHHMAYKDLPRLINETDINSDVTAGCKAPNGATAAPAFCVPVERMSGGDVGMNRSLFQREISVNHVTWKAANCNKEGATLTVQQPIPTTFPNPPLGPLAPFIGVILGGSGSCPTSNVAPPPATSYKACTLIEQKSGAIFDTLSFIGKAKVVIKDPEIQLCATAVGAPDLGAAQERESGIDGFTLTPTPKSIHRFAFATRNQFVKDLFNPFATINGVALPDFEPNGLYQLEVPDPDARVNGKALNFLSALGPLLSAFHQFEDLDADGWPSKEYLFVELQDVIHMHYSSPQTAVCPTKNVKGHEGCIQSNDPKSKFFAYGTNAVSYEPLMSWAMLDQDLMGVLARSTTAISKVNVDVLQPNGQTVNRNGLDILNDFLTALLKSNPDIKYKDGRSYAMTNLCSGPDSGDPTKCACPAGSTPTDDGLWCQNADGSWKQRGRIVPGNGVPPVYPLLDALKDIDNMWTSDEERHEVWLSARSALVDQFVKVDQAPDKTTRFRNRRTKAFLQKALPWLFERMDAHKDDLGPWADGLTDRLAVVFAHPIGARALDVLDRIWEDNGGASEELVAIFSYLLDEAENPALFADLTVSVADTLTFFNNDPGYTPVLNLIALLASQQSLDAVKQGGDASDANEGSVFRLLEVTRAIAQADGGSQLSTLAKLLRNTALPMQGGELDGKSPLEVYIDLVADVNRNDPTVDTTVTLAPDDNARVFDQVDQFMSDKNIGLQRLYQVIDSRNLD